MMNHVSTENDREWQRVLNEIERRSFESHADLIGKISKFRYLAKNSIGIQQEIYKKELKKLNKKLKDRSL